jgi:toxin CptA
MHAAGGALTLAIASAALMGMAIQRGATCMVAAVDEAMSQRRYGRLRALAEAALWVGGLVALAQLAGVQKVAVSRYEVDHSTVLGGVLLGLGAWLNRACVFGAIARIGSGQLAWLGTPVGFFLGSLIPLQTAVASPSAPFPWPVGLVVTLAALVLWRVAQAIRAPALSEYLWHPHRATLLIAVTFFSTTLTVGLWAYTDALAELARAMSALEARLATRGTMVLALLGGAIAGGWLAGKLQWQRATAPTILRCVFGGALMGAGALLVPGSNDGLIMLGLPLLLPHAWVAVTIMAATIATMVGLARALGKPATA